MSPVSVWINSIYEADVAVSRDIIPSDSLCLTYRLGWELEPRAEVSLRALSPAVTR
jgi:hypothetical protein